MGKSIFIIDDDITALDITSFLIEEHGFEVTRFGEGPLAVDSLKMGHPDLIIADLMMPKVDGIETILMLRKGGYEGPIVAFTALDEGEIHQRAYDAGCDLLLTKPCRPNVLLKHISALISDA